MASEAAMSPPATWKTSDVITWATVTKLAPDIVSSLNRNEVDGPTLVTLTKFELQSELGISSLPARRYLWELIKSLRSEQATSDYSAAIEVHEQEIQLLSLSKVSGTRAQIGPDSASGENRNSFDGSSMSVIVEELYKGVELQRQVIEDHMMAFRVQKMLNNGEDVCKDAEFAHTEQERLDRILEQTERDRAYAESLAGGNERAIINNRRRAEAGDTDKETPDIPQKADSRISSLFGLSVQACSDNEVDVAEAFRTGKAKPLVNLAVVNDEDSDSEEEDGRKPAAVPRGIFNLPYIDQCNVCYEENLKGYNLACGHLQCVQCMRKLFQISLGDTKLLPLRCCDIPIDMNIAKDLLNTKDATLIFQRMEEKLAKNKMYCPSCSLFLNLDLIDTSESLDLRCGCGKDVCTACKTESHPGLTCRQNQATKSGSDELVLELSREKGWKQCPKCSVLIELRSGCNHMTCTSCDQEFCYRCLREWDTRQAQCSSGTCELWDENLLIEAGEARVQQEEAARGIILPEPVRRERFQRAIEGLRANEVCNHQWVRSSGYKGECPNCGFEMFAYGMRCRSDCGSTVCYTCAHHRIPRRGWR